MTGKDNVPDGVRCTRFPADVDPACDWTTFDRGAGRTGLSSCACVRGDVPAHGCRLSNRALATCLTENAAPVRHAGRRSRQRMSASFVMSCEKLMRACRSCSDGEATCETMHVALLDEAKRQSR